MPNSVLNNTHIASISVFLQSSKATQVLSQDGYNSHCVFMLDQILVCPPDTMMMVGLTSGEIPYTFYNIGQTNNRLVLKTQLGTNPKSNDILIIVENQNYSVDSLVIYLNTQLAVHKIVVEFDENKNKFIFSGVLVGTDQYYVELISTTMGKELGISDVFSSGMSQTFTCPNVCNLSGTGSVYVNLNNISISNLDSRGTVNGIVGKMNVSCNPGDFIFHSLTEIQYYVTTDRVIPLFSVSITDDDGSQINFNGCHWSISLTVHFCKKPEVTVDSKMLLNKRSTLNDLETLEGQEQAPRKNNKKVKPINK